MRGLGSGRGHEGRRGRRCGLGRWWEGGFMLRDEGVECMDVIVDLRVG